MQHRACGHALLWHPSHAHWRGPREDIFASITPLPFSSVAIITPKLATRSCEIRKWTFIACGDSNVLHELHQMLAAVHMPALLGAIVRCQVRASELPHVGAPVHSTVDAAAVRHGSSARRPKAFGSPRLGLRPRCAPCCGCHCLAILQLWRQWKTCILTTATRVNAAIDLFQHAIVTNDHLNA